MARGQLIEERAIPDDRQDAPIWQVGQGLSPRLEQHLDTHPRDQPPDAHGNERALDATSYALLVGEIFGSLGLSLACEPGRVLSAAAGLLVSQVVYVKESSTRRFVIVDAGRILTEPAAGGAGEANLASQARLPGARVLLASPDLVVFLLPGS